ncbi:hypothetical protein GGS24DRAFT_504109 [Hypoxylon argillaceum]|nr:hypothetical protein GGS24DRAFT_504109 [Hypoxylon argillaceum]
MSGIEIAGLVLAAFTIAIEGLKKYREIAEGVDYWYNVRYKYTCSLNELIFHRTVFQQNLYQLLSPLAHDKDQLRDLIANPGGAGWNDPAIQQGLEKRLQESYHLYLGLMKEMQKTMQDLNKESYQLIISIFSSTSEVTSSTVPQDQPAFSQPSTTSRFRKLLSQPNRAVQCSRINFIFSKSTRTRLFSELQAYNDRLQRLTPKGDSLPEPQAGHQISKSKSATSITSVALCKFWNHADRLYRALMGAWGCTCYEQHYAELILQDRQPQDNDFLLHFCPGEQSGSSMEPGRWSSCSILLQMHEQKETQTSDVLSPQESARNINIPLSTPQHQPQQLPDATENIINNLCITLGTTIKPKSFINFHDGIRYYLTQEKLPTTHSSIPLSTVLSGTVKITRLQRYHISMTIASSFVQLKDTPWFQTPWGKENVYFFYDKDQHTLLLDSPFIVGSFTSRSLDTLPDAIHNVAGIESLGILLLELCFGTSIDNHPSQRTYKSDEQTQALVNLFIAQNWLKDVRDEAGRKYYKAVRWCLSCRTMPRTGVWRELMVEKVVVPLKQCLEHQRKA